MVIYLSEELNIPQPLKSLNLEPYDRVRIIKGSMVYEGLLMPKTEVLGDDYVLIKMDNGYNVGFKLSDVKIELLSKRQYLNVEGEKPLKLKVELPKVTVVGTGGTIASKVEYRTGAVYPSLSAEDLYESIPELSEVAIVTTRTLFNIFSEDMRPEHWSMIAKAVAEEAIKDDVSGVVIAHGTDTMGYTAAALSFALQQLPVPIALVGAQRSSDRPSSDAALNMLGATVIAARAPFAEVVVVMHESISDDNLIAIRGTRARKCHTSRRDAFKPINDMPVARVVNGRDIVVLAKDLRSRSEERKNLKLHANFDKRAALIKVYPGIPPEAVEWTLSAGYRGLVIEGTGLGHAPSYLFSSIKKLIDHGMIIAMSSQCLWGRVNMNVYRTGVELLRMGVIPCGDMLPETALVKLMWCLANAKNEEEVKKLMLTNIAGEMGLRTEHRG